MKSNYTGLWLLLAVAMIIVISLSFADDFSLGKWQVKKAPYAEMLLKSPGAVAPLSGKELTDSLNAALEKWRLKWIPLRRVFCLSAIP